jgi:hypothetical protein
MVTGAAGDGREIGLSERLVVSQPDERRIFDIQYLGTRSSPPNDEAGKCCGLTGGRAVRDG